MVFKGITPDGREIFSINYSDRPHGNCILVCDKTFGKYVISKTKLSISFDGEKTWLKYSEVKK